MFLETDKVLDNLEVGKEVEIVFPYEEGTVIAKNSWGMYDIRVSCGCSSAYNRKKKNCIVVKYTPQEVPKHLVEEGINFYETTKKVFVKYYNKDSKDKKYIELKFSGLVIDNKLK